MSDLVRTLILVEDHRFFHHWGVDFLAIARAFLVNISEGRRAQGGSTITQQLARTLYLHNRKTFARKFVEMFVAFYLEVKYTKQEILKLYMDSVYMGMYRGSSIRGFDNASAHYFGKSLADTSFAEQAALVAMVKGPNLYKPSSDYGVARRIFVLSKMLSSGIVTQDEFFEASKERL